ncbi:MAG: hypothetical protein JNL81_17785 [Hyphomonadaceae bacterium]|nr:hypothetical protein [Hyphomonadaceae bacterium]
MTGNETEGVIEWRASPGWALQWLSLLVLVALPFLALGAWLAAAEIASAPVGTSQAYLFSLGALATLVLGALTLAVMSGVLTYVRLLFDRAPILRADRYGLQVRMFKPIRAIAWQDIDTIEIERTRRIGRRDHLVRQILVRPHDANAPELTIKPQMADVTLEDGHAQLSALHARFR